MNGYPQWLVDCALFAAFYGCACVAVMEARAERAREQWLRACVDTLIAVWAFTGALLVAAFQIWRLTQGG